MHLDINEFLNNSIYMDFVFRIFIAMICGAVVGIEREKRFKNAGLRTHIIIALASCLMMLISKYGFMDIVTIDGYRLQTDGSRIAASVVQAIGFISAGVIFVRNGNAIGLTTSAGLWATVGIGLAIGAGMYTIGISATVGILLVQWVFHPLHTKTHPFNSGVIKCNLTKHGITFEDFKAELAKQKLSVRDVTVNGEGNTIRVTVSVVFKDYTESIEIAQTFPYCDSFEVVHFSSSYF